MRQSENLGRSKVGMLNFHGVASCILEADRNPNSKDRVTKTILKTSSRGPAEAREMRD